MLEQVCSGLREVTVRSTFYVGTLTVRWGGLAELFTEQMKSDGVLKEDQSSGLNKRQ